MFCVHMFVSQMVLIVRIKREEVLLFTMPCYALREKADYKVAEGGAGRLQNGTSFKASRIYCQCVLLGEEN